MTESLSDDLDLNSMSMDDLDSLLNEAEGKPTEEAEPETDQPKQEEVQESEAVEEDQPQEEVQEEPKSQTQETVDEDESQVEPQYRGKTREDLLDMQRNANRKISQQSNEIYHLKKKMEEFMQSQKERATNEAHKSEEEDLLSKYEPEDIDAIDKLLEKKLKDRENQKVAQVNAEREKAMAEHDEMWDNLKIFNPTFFQSIEQEAIAIMKSDTANTYHQKGWMKKFIADRLKGTQVAKPVQKSVNKKRGSTVTGGGVSKNSNQRVNKSVTDMTAQEYEQHMLSQGIKF